MNTVYLLEQTDPVSYDTYVVGVYSTQELANAAMKFYKNAIPDLKFEVVSKCMDKEPVFVAEEELEENDPPKPCYE